VFAEPVGGAGHGAERGERLNFIARGLVPRAYPRRHPNAVRAPQRVDARVKARA
jgi:hypothetical protein